MKRRIIYTFLVGLVALWGCEKENYLLYDDSQVNRMYFATDTLTFIYGAREDQECDLEVPVKLIGLANLDEDAEFLVVADEFHSTAKAGIHYELAEKQYFRKDSVTAVVKLDFKKEALIRDMQYTLQLYLKGNDSYQPTNHISCKITFGDITLPQPGWWLPDRLGTYNQEKYVLFMKYFRESREITPILYDQIVGLWGEFLDNEKHDRYVHLLTTYTYVSYFKQYIYTPMYEYYQKSGDEHYMMPDPLTL